MTGDNVLNRTSSTGRMVRLWIDVTLVDGADPDTAAEHLFDLAGDDPSDVAPEIETVLNYGVDDG